jgi:hypothetical protein
VRAGLHPTAPADRARTPTPPGDGTSLLASHGIRVTGKWWTGQTWKLIRGGGPAWVVERLWTLMLLIEPMEAEEKAMTEVIQEKGAEAA